MIHPYPPVLTLTLSYLYKIFGLNLGVLKAFSWTVIMLSSVCVWLLTREITKRDSIALMSLGVYVLLQPILEGNMMWFDIAIVPPILLGVYFLFRQNLFWGGFFLALAGFIKQTGGIFYLVVLGWLIWRDKSTLLRPGLKKPYISFLFGPIIFGIPLLIKLIWEDALMGFWNWVVYYPSIYWSKFPNYVQMSPEKLDLLIVGIILFPLFTLLINKKKLWKDKNLTVLSGFTLLSLISVYPRFSFFHLQTTLALSSVAFGFIVFTIPNKLKILPIASVGIIYLLLWPQLRLEWNKETRFYTPEDQMLAQEISTLVKKDEPVFLQGLHSSFYVQADRLPPKPWGDNFGWYYEIPNIQEETIKKWEQNPPETIVWRIPEPGNWHDLGTYEPQKVVVWIKENYYKEKEMKPGVWIWRRKMKV